MVSVVMHFSIFVNNHVGILLLVLQIALLEESIVNACIPEEAPRLVNKTGLMCMV